MADPNTPTLQILAAAAPNQPGVREPRALDTSAHATPVDQEAGKRLREADEKFRERRRKRPRT